jgi:hypothetical protein
MLPVLPMANCRKEVKIDTTNTHIVDRLDAGTSINSVVVKLVYGTKHPLVLKKASTII